MLEPQTSSSSSVSRRIEQLNSLVQREVAAVVRREVEFPLDTIVTVTRATVADDAESAKVWISVLPFDQAESVMQELKKRIADIQRVLNKRLVMKFVPKITFYLDKQEEKADRINDVLDRLTDEGEIRLDS